MSESTERVKRASDKIGKVFYGWLGTEVETSSTTGDLNTYLNDFETVRGGLSKGWDHPDNFPARKLESHLNRLPHWLEAYKLAPKDDYQAARLSFAGLMHVSGAYRAQCYMEAGDGEDYMKRRFEVIGIDMPQLVNDRLRQIVPTGNFANADVSIESFEEEAKRVSKIGELAIKKMAGRAKMGFDLTAFNTPSTKHLQEAQAEWVSLATDAVVLATKDRHGILEAVPFLEPISISSQSEKAPHYPLRSDFPGWAEAMAA